MEDERLSVINQQKQEAINQSNNMYEGLLTDNENIYNQQLDYANQYEQTQNEALDKQLAFQQEQIEKQKQEAQQIKETEAKKAKNDYTSFVNPYGYQAERMASQGLANSGVSETAKLGSWNTYQNRLATANKAMQDAFTEYDNAINEARLNNDVQKAQNALNKLQMQLEYAQNYYSNKSTISQNQLSNNQALDSDYYNRYQTEYNNIQAEKEREEAIRQFNEQLALQQQQFEYQKTQDALAQENWEKEYALAQQQARASYGGYGSLTDSSSSSNSEELSGTKADNGRNIVENPYTGTINPDTKYGVFEWKDGSGYQPNNINGNKLSKSGKTVSEMLGTTGNTGSTGINIDKQNVWTTGGKYYVWDGSQDKYIDITSEIPSKSEDEYTKTDLYLDTVERQLTSRFPFSLFK